MPKYTKLSILLMAILFMGFFRGDDDVYLKISKSIDIFGRIYKEVSLKYVDKIEPEEFMISGIEGLLSSLDPYTVYIDETMQQDIDVITKGKYGGIGASVGLRNNKVTIVDLIEGYSAQRQGIRIGDVIKQIDSVKINSDNYSELSGYLKGEPGTIVSVLIVRDGYEKEILFDLVREEVELKNLTYYGFYPENSGNVYLKLSGFSRTAGEEIKQALFKLKNQRPIESVMLDLRGNPGGLLDAAIDVSEKFLNKGQLVVSVIGRDTSKVTKYFAEENPAADSTKLIVLVDGSSASASEIVAGAIQDHDRGIILGERSFGKGLVQTLVPLSYNTSLKITTSKYFTPSGRSIQRIDYAKDNDVLREVIIPVDSMEFATDRKRRVYSGGGILPDTIVSNMSKSSLIRSLIAEGMFFKFATKYFNTNEDVNLLLKPDDELYQKFKAYLAENNYDFSNSIESLLSKLKKAAAKERYGDEFKSKISELENLSEQTKIAELSLYKNDIASEIRKEIISRTEGREGRIKEALKHDDQISTALTLLQNEVVFNQMLNVQL
ncbi:MAG: carboxyl-terminal processing protease [Melioribacteraceae bacterium]|nr:MAG: carboxyl-terminal processing protease [Melioribacteraceae bacterium]